MESVCRHFPALPHARRCHNIFYVSRKLTRGASDRLLSVQSVSIGFDGVRLPTFSTPFTTLLCSLSLSRTDTQRIRWNFPAPPQELYFAVYLLSLSQLTRGESDIDSCNGEQSPSDPMESFCRHIFHSIRNSILCCIFTKSLAN